MALFQATQQHIPHARYLSHELRTPLNTTWLGIQLLTGEASAAADGSAATAIDAAARAALNEQVRPLKPLPILPLAHIPARVMDEQLDILTGMGAACKTAVDILDDMIQVRHQFTWKCFGCAAGPSHPGTLTAVRQDGVRPADADQAPRGRGWLPGPGD